MNAYTVKFLLDGDYQLPLFISFLAKNKYDAYDKAVFEIIPRDYGQFPYAAWVADVTYQNGNVHRFNTFAGKPY